MRLHSLALYFCKLLFSIFANQKHLESEQLQVWQVGFFLQGLLIDHLVQTGQDHLLKELSNRTGYQELRKVVEAADVVLQVSGLALTQHNMKGRALLSKVARQCQSTPCVLDLTCYHYQMYEKQPSSGNGCHDNQAQLWKFLFHDIRRLSVNPFFSSGFSLHDVTWSLALLYVLLMSAALSAHMTKPFGHLVHWGFFSIYKHVAVKHKDMKLFPTALCFWETPEYVGCCFNVSEEWVMANKKHRACM